MKCNLHARADAVSAEEIATVHHRIFGHLRDHSRLCAGRSVPAVPRVKRGGLTACAAFDEFLASGMTGCIVYEFRRDPGTYVLSGQDYLSIDFEADASLYRDVVDDFIPHLIRAMKPFVLKMGDERFDEPLLQADGSAKIGGPKACGCELKPVFYLADWWIEEAYRISLDEASSVLKSFAEKVEVMQDGLYVVAVRDLVSFEQACETVQRMEKSLRQAKPGLMKFFRSVFRK